MVGHAKAQRRDANREVPHFHVHIFADRNLGAMPAR